MANTRPKSGHAAMQAAVTLTMGGIQNDLPSGTRTLPVDGTSLTPTQVESQLQAWLTAANAVQTTKVAYTTALANLKSLTPGVRALMLAIKAWAKAQFGSTNVAELANFGIAVTPRKAQTVATKAHGQAKRSATVAAKKAAASSTGSSVALVVGDNGVQFAAPAVSPAAASATAPTVGK